MTKCEMCGKEDVPLLLANHRDLGIIYMCSECWGKNWHSLLSQGGGEGDSGGCC